MIELLERWAKLLLLSGYNTKGIVREEIQEELNKLKGVNND